jgi:uncharacterized protein (DUF1697 family)
MRPLDWSHSETYIALLRGVNVGGKHKAPMAELRAMLEELGFEDPKTLLQSGNAVFRSDKSGPALESLLEREFAHRFGFSVDFFVRTAAELDKVIAANPFSAEAKSDPSHLLVVFLKDQVQAADVKAVQAAIQGPERIEAHGRDLYIVYPEGIGASKVDRTPGWKNLAGAGTARNWNTVLKLGDLSSTVI